MEEKRTSEGRKIGQRMYTKIMLSVATAGLLGLGFVAYSTYNAPNNSSQAAARVQKIEAEIPKLAREISDLFRNNKARGLSAKVYQNSSYQISLAEEYAELMSRPEVRNIISQKERYDKIAMFSGTALAVGLLCALFGGNPEGKEEKVVDYRLKQED